MAFLFFYQTAVEIESVDLTEIIPALTNPSVGNNWPILFFRHIEEAFPARAALDFHRTNCLDPNSASFVKLIIFISRFYPQLLQGGYKHISRLQEVLKRTQDENHKLIPHPARKVAISTYISVT